MKHFSHPHPLEESEVGEDKEIICSCCEEELSGEVYSCSKSKCKFSLHKSCFEFPKKIKHKSHLEHQLILHSKPPSEFCIYYGCDACEGKFNAFIYHCSECQVYIHPKCAFLPETVNRNDHEHPLKLYYSFPCPEENYGAVFVCNICQDIAAKNPWVYYCPECDYGTHLSCVNREPVHVEEESKDDEVDEEEQISGEESSDEKNKEETDQAGDDPMVNKMKHFSHPHPLEEFEVGEDEKIICSCCEEDLSGEAYYCSKSKCKFSLHKSCFEFPRKIKHESHLEHQLTLHSKPPSEFCIHYSCDACDNKFDAFIYHCSECQVYIHPKCAFLPETVNRNDHEHPLKLYYSFPYPEQNSDAVFVCKICQDIATKTWVYYCPECDYGTHLGCVNNDPVPVEEESKDDEDYDDDPRILHIKAMDRMARLRFQMEMNALNAKTMQMLCRRHI